MLIVDNRAFGGTAAPTDADDFRPLFEPDRFVLACDPDDGSIIGITGDFPLEVTLPGGGTLPAPGVTWVSVAVTHRRRGLLRRMLAEQHRGFIDAGVAVSLLTASEGGIYGRFGYGTATQRRWVEITRPRAAMRPGAPDPGGVRLVETDELRKLAPSIHRRWAAATPGARVPQRGLVGLDAARPRARPARRQRAVPSGPPRRLRLLPDSSRGQPLRGAGGRRGHRAGARRALAGAAGPRSGRHDQRRAAAGRPATGPAHRCPAGAHHRAARRHVGSGVGRAGRAGRPPVPGGNRRRTDRS